MKTPLSAIGQIVIQETAMGSETLVQGHAFDFETGICTRCGMSEIEFEKQGEPQCTGRRADTGGGQPGYTGS